MLQIAKMNKISLHIQPEGAGSVDSAVCVTITFLLNAHTNARTV